MGLAWKPPAHVTFLVYPAEWLRAKHLLRTESGVLSPKLDLGIVWETVGGPGPEAWKMLLTTRITTQLEVLEFLTSCLFCVCFTFFGA